MKSINKSFVYFICLVSALGGLLFGYDWVVIGGAKPFYELYFGITDNPSMQGFAMSIALIGCLVGAMTTGFLADRIGRRPLLLVSAAIFFLTAYGTGAVNVFYLFLIVRFIGGVAIGIASGLSPMYIGEVAPDSIRGKLVSLNQLTIVLGILGAQIMNWLLADPIPQNFTPADVAASWNGQMGWRYMFWGAMIPSALFLILTFFIPESPRWYVMNGKYEKGRKVWWKIGGEEYAQEQLRVVRDGISHQENQGGLKTLFSSRYRMILILGIVLGFFQQWCGTNVIFNYAQEIFQNAGYSLGDVLFNIVITGIANFIFTFVAIFTVDKWGRKALMWFGAGSLGCIYLILGIYYYMHITGFFMIILVVAAIACYAMSLGPVTWVLLSEIFPTRLRAVAMATSTFALWVGSATLTYTFPLLNSSLGSYGTFWIYTLVCLCGFIFFKKYLPETKGKSLEQLENELSKE